MGDMDNVIKLDVLDMKITAVLTDIICMTVLGAYGGYDITREEFGKMLDGGLRDSIYKAITDYYESWGDISVEISDDELYVGLMQVIKEAV